jgi:hypothetical protein
MKYDEWWKNFGLGMELHASGSFVYNGIKELDDLEGLNHSSDIFQILYNLSVGIERILKVAIILIEHNEQVSIEEFEKSLITHNTIDLANRLNDRLNLGLSNLHNEFLALLSKFYKTHRYGRYSLNSIPHIHAEKVQFLEFIQKHLSMEFDISNEFVFIENTDRIRKFVGKIVKKITDSSFSIIQARAKALNIYTDEIRCDSKAFKVFYGTRLDFIDEKLIRKEVLLYLIHPNACGNHIDILRSFDCLKLDPDLAPLYIKALFNDVHLPYVVEDINERYTEISNISERIHMLGLIDNDNLSGDIDR